jgi:hypothetical protein
MGKFPVLPLLIVSQLRTGVLLGVSIAGNLAISKEPCCGAASSAIGTFPRHQTFGIMDDDYSAVYG